ncbi:ribose-phosphate pyrophosphokinase [Pseudomonadota bacterium]
MKILVCSGNIPLAEDIAKHLGTNPIDADIKRFNDGEISVKLNETVRGEEVFIIQSTSSPVNENVMELLLVIDTLKRASARKIGVVLPYYGYARQDRRSEPRSPVSAKLIADLLTKAGAHRVITLDLHAKQIHGFFDIPVDELYANLVFSENIRETVGSNIMIVSPDSGGVSRARFFAQKLNCDLGIIDKRREKAGVCEVMNVIGDVKGKNCIIMDDIVDSGGTLCNAAKALKKNGAKSVSAYIVHGVFSGKAVERISESVLKKLVVTNSIKHPKEVLNCEKIKIVSVAKLFAEGIERIFKEESIFSLSEQ